MWEVVELDMQYPHSKSAFELPVICKIRKEISGLLLRDMLLFHFIKFLSFYPKN